ncbi:MAG: hypothetical protein V7745_02620 [Pseudomonadales bacterium]
MPSKAGRDASKHCLILGRKKNLSNHNQFQRKDSIEKTYITMRKPSAYGEEAYKTGEDEVINIRYDELNRLTLTNIATPSMLVPEFIQSRGSDSFKG